MLCQHQPLTNIHNQGGRSPYKHESSDCCETTVKQITEVGIPPNPEKWYLSLSCTQSLKKIKKTTAKTLKEKTQEYEEYNCYVLGFFLKKRTDFFCLVVIVKCSSEVKGLVLRVCVVLRFKEDGSKQARGVAASVISIQVNP